MLPKHLRLLQGEFVGILLVTDAGGLLLCGVLGQRKGPFQAEKMQYTISDIQVRNLLMLADWLVGWLVGWLFSNLAWVFVQVVAVRSWHSWSGAAKLTQRSWDHGLQVEADGDAWKSSRMLLQSFWWRCATWEYYLKMTEYTIPKQIPLSSNPVKHSRSKAGNVAAGWPNSRRCPGLFAPWRDRHRVLSLVWLLMLQRREGLQQLRNQIPVWWLYSYTQIFEYCRCCWS